MCFMCRDSLSCPQRAVFHCLVEEIVKVECLYWRAGFYLSLCVPPQRGSDELLSGGMYNSPSSGLSSISGKCP